MLLGLRKKCAEILRSPYFLVGLLSACLFCLTFGTRVLNPQDAGWLLSGGDLSQHYLGWCAYRNSDWLFPIGLCNTLAWPHQTSVIFTDSIPLFALVFKCLSSLLPKTFQYFGFWGIFCFVLQGLMAVRLLHGHMTNKAVLVVSSLLVVLTPVMIFRMYGHTALAGNWLILLALDPIFNVGDYSDANAKKLYFYAGTLGLLVPLVHLYYLIMCGIVLTGLCVMLAVRGEGKRIPLILAAYIGVAGVTIWLLGGFATSASADAGGLGAYSYNLNGLLNPMGFSTFMKDHATTSDAQAEGFAYLGLGFIAISAFDVMYVVLNWKRVWALLIDWKPYAFALIFMIIASTVFAASPTVSWSGRVLYQMSLPSPVFNAWSIFRASGRIIWVTVYVIELISIIAFFRIQKPYRALPIAALCLLLLQAWDIKPLLVSKHNQVSGQCTYTSPLNTASYWNALSADKLRKHVVFCTDLTEEQMYALAVWAMGSDKTISNFYFARSLGDIPAKYADERLRERHADDIYVFGTDDESVEERLRGSNLDVTYVDGLVVAVTNP